MTWDVNWPDGTKSVKANLTTGNNNMSYIETKLQLDHYYDESGDDDGHHAKVELPTIDVAEAKLTAQGITLTDDFPQSLGSNQSCMYFARTKTATEAPDLQMAEPYAYTIKDPGGTPINQYMQLGFRCLVNFTVDTSANSFAIVIKYSHNVASVVRNSEGEFTVTFTKELPTNNYIPFGTAMRRASGTPSGSNPLFIAPLISNTKTDSFTTASFTFRTFSSSDSPRDPSLVTLAIVGG